MRSNTLFLCFLGQLRAHEAPRLASAAKLNPRHGPSGIVVNIVFQQICNLIGVRAWMPDLGAASGGQVHDLLIKAARRRQLRRTVHVRRSIRRVGLRIRAIPPASNRD